jgi:hypothetical protein
MFDSGPKRLRGTAVRHKAPKRLAGSARRLSGPRAVGRRWPSRRWLLAGLGLLALIGLVGLLSLLETDNPHPRLGGINLPPINQSLTHPSGKGGVAGATLGGGGGSEAGGGGGDETSVSKPSETSAPRPDRVYRKDERDIENHEVTVEERKVSHPHHANFDLSLLAVAVLAVFAAPAVKRRKLVSGKLTRLVTPLAALVALILAIASVHTWESPKPPKLVSLHTAQYHPEMQPEGVDRHREGNTIYVVHHFSREEPVRRLEHIHAWSLEASSQWPLLVLSTFLTAFLMHDRWVAKRGRLTVPRGPKNARPL